MNEPFTVPDEIDLLGFFESEPVEGSIEDGYWCYEVTDTRGVCLRFSFNLFEQSVQTARRLGTTPLATVVHEGAETMRLEGQTLTCRFSYAGAESKLTVCLGESITVDWASLRTG